MHNVSTEGASPGGRRLSRSFHSCLRGADHDDLESGRLPITGLNESVEARLQLREIRCKILYNSWTEKEELRKIVRGKEKEK